jgi:uncharacterized protein (TIGR02145 family)
MVATQKLRPTAPFVRRRLRPAANAQFDALRRRQLRVGVLSGNLCTSQKDERWRQCYPFEDKKKEWRGKKESRINHEKIYFSKTFNAEVLMVPIKALLIGLAGVSLSMANISGIVTDTGTTPIPGAVVKLETGGQTATTGADGSFTLVVGGTGILPGNSKLKPNGLTAGITGNLMTVTIAERAVVEVSTFDLNGKALSTVRKTLDAGSHSIALSQRGTGIYLYKVKSGNGEVVLKGNSLGGASSGSAVTSQGLSSNSLAKQAKAAAAINDVINVTKDGLLIYRVVVTNSDTTGIQIKMIASAGTVTDVDGNVYQTVRIGSQVWMVENLRVTKYNDGSAISLDTSTATWVNDTTPKYCFYNNTTIKNYGALYNWYVVSPSNPKKIAPVGWHVPSNSEWFDLLKSMVFNGYNWDGTRDSSGINNNGDNTLGKSLAAKTDWNTQIGAGRDTSKGIIGFDLTKNNSSGFSALPSGYRNLDGKCYARGNLSNWWTATQLLGDASRAENRDLNYASFYLGTSSADLKSYGHSVRLLKDN